MAANLEHSIQQGVQTLTEEQQRKVLALIEKLKGQATRNQQKYSFIGIGRSGKRDLSRRAEELLQEANRREGWSLQ